MIEKKGEILILLLIKASNKIQNLIPVYNL